MNPGEQFVLTLTAATESVLCVCALNRSEKGDTKTKCPGPMFTDLHQHKIIRATLLNTQTVNLAEHKRAKDQLTTLLLSH